MEFTKLENYIQKTNEKYECFYNDTYNKTDFLSVYYSKDDPIGDLYKKYKTDIWEELKTNSPVTYLFYCLSDFIFGNITERINSAAKILMGQETEPEVVDSIFKTIEETNNEFNYDDYQGLESEELEFTSKFKELSLNKFDSPDRKKHKQKLTRTLISEIEKSAKCYFKNYMNEQNCIQEDRESLGQILGIDAPKTSHNSALQERRSKSAPPAPIDHQEAVKYQADYRALMNPYNFSDEDLSSCSE